MRDTLSRDVADDVAGITGDRKRERASGASILRLLAASAAAAFVITVVGGYELGWTWTGFADNDTVWDWLHLLVLPVVLTVAPVWYGTRRQLRVEWRLLVAAVLGAFAVLLAGGYWLGWTWTGFDGRTLWDWLELLVLPATVTVLPIWLALGRSMHPRLRRAGTAAIVAFALLVTAGYGFDWRWTGFPGNTLWDWLHLLLVPFVLPIVLAWFSTRLEQESPQADQAAGVSRDRPAEAG
jgi:heme/copper-type cytochrome/quinol oxidase subunit 4